MRPPIRLLLYPLLSCCALALSACATAPADPHAQHVHGADADTAKQASMCERHTAAKADGKMQEKMEAHCQ